MPLHPARVYAPASTQQQPHSSDATHVTGNQSDPQGQTGGKWRAVDVLSPSKPVVFRKDIARKCERRGEPSRAKHLHATLGEAKGERAGRRVALARGLGHIVPYVWDGTPCFVQILFSLCGC